MSTPLHTCTACGGFVPEASRRCPNCTSSSFKPRRFAWLFAVTMSACYGVAPRYAEGPQQPDCTDADGDGSCAPQDCNDADATVVPGAADTDGDAIDQNCDGVDGWRDPAEVATPPQE